VAAPPGGVSEVASAYRTQPTAPPPGLPDSLEPGGSRAGPVPCTRGPIASWGAPPDLAGRRGDSLRPMAFRSRLADGRTLAVLGLVYLASQLAIAGILHPLGPGTVLELQTTFSAERFREILEQWRTAGLLDRYRAHYGLDLLHPVLYGALLAALLARGLDAHAAPARWDRLLWLPVAAAACDGIENGLHLWVLADPARIGAALVAASAFAAWLKWALVAVSLVVATALLVRGRGGRPERSA